MLQHWMTSQTCLPFSISPVIHFQDVGVGDNTFRIIFGLWTQDSRMGHLPHSEMDTCFSSRGLWSRRRTCQIAKS